MKRISLETVKTSILKFGMVVVMAAVFVFGGLALETVMAASCTEHEYVNGFCKVCDAYEPAVQNADGVYEIGNAGQLYWFANEVNNGNNAICVELTNDIVVNEKLLKEKITVDDTGVATVNDDSIRAWIQNGNFFNSNSYVGIFDGKDCIVSGLYFNETVRFVGLIGCLGQDGVIKNVAIEDSYFCGSYFVGSICGKNDYGTIMNSSNNGVVCGQGSLGGICGENMYGTIIDSDNNGMVKAIDSDSESVGGVCGRNSSGSIVNCRNIGTVSGTDHVGGVCGENSSYRARIIMCTNIGMVNGDYRTGGITGYNSGSVENCSNSGIIKGDFCVGGIVGGNYGSFLNCINIGTICGERVIGGVCGHTGYSMANSYYLLGCATDGDGVIQNGIGASVKGENVEDIEFCTMGKNLDEFASGEVTYCLNERTSEGTLAWGQLLGKGGDKYPVLGSKSIVYVSMPCESIYSNKKNIERAHSCNKGDKCNYCGLILNENRISIIPEKPLLGDGSSDNPYQIETAAQLYWFAGLVNGDELVCINGVEQNSNACAKLLADIVINEELLTYLIEGYTNGVVKILASDINEWIPIGYYDNEYMGIFDGNGKSISGLFYDNKQVECVGMFGVLGENGELKNLMIEDSYFGGDSDVGAVCGYNIFGNISCCSNNGMVSGLRGNIGGICGSNDGGNITACYNKGMISGLEDHVGGICGNNYDGNIESCYYLTMCAIDGYGTVQYGIGTYIGQNEEDIVGQTVGKTEEQFASGEVAYLLNGSTSEDDSLVWGQIIGKETSPILGSAPVYNVINCSGGSYSNANVAGEHYYGVDGMCHVCVSDQGVGDFVNRMYSLILDREPDAGSQTWIDGLKDGSFTGVKVAEGFIMSNEFLGKDISNEEFVKIMYRAFFGREADEGGLATWKGSLDEGYMKKFVFAGFANSNEFRALCDTYGIECGDVKLTLAEQTPNLSEQDFNIWQFVERLYSEVMGRNPDQTGMDTWVGVLKAGTYTGAQVAEGFILSNEFLNKNMTNDEFVRIMYRAFFNRDADSAGFETWTNALETGWTKEAVFAGFANSAEFGRICDEYGIIQGSVISEK